eukprot:scaffold187248_cov17-Tisochrysis_lutea.AAC.1
MNEIALLRLMGNKLRACGKASIPAGVPTGPASKISIPIAAVVKPGIREISAHTSSAFATN